MKALIAAVNYWGSPLMVGSHHIGKSLAQAGWDVAFIGNPISPLHLSQGVSPELKARFNQYRNRPITDKPTRLWPYVPGALLTPFNKPLLRSEWVHRNWHKITFPNVVKKIRQKGFGEVDLLYLDSPVQSFWLDAIQSKASVFRIADSGQGFSRNAPVLERLEGELARKVDLVVYSASNMADEIQSYSPRKKIHLPNGVDFDHFAQGKKEIPALLAKIPSPRAVYIGAMDDWFDYELINRAVKELPHVSFVLIGPDSLARTRLIPASNLFLLGRIPFSDLPGYLHNSQVGILPFDVLNFGRLVHSINPLKLYEYMACGLPVVSVRWNELERLNTPAHLCSGDAQFIQGISAAIQNPGDGDTRRRFAKAQDWSIRIRELLETAGIVKGIN